MKKTDYFEALERLAKNALSAVKLACGSGCKTSREEVTKIRLECDKEVCALENALFEDFITPIERDNIAALAHSLWRVSDKAIELYLIYSQRPKGIENGEEALCITLAEKLLSATKMLREIRSPEKTPSFCDFREILRKAFEAHNEYLSLINSGSVPRSYARRAFSVAKVRGELSRCFDELVEVMLGSI